MSYFRKIVLIVTLMTSAAWADSSDPQVVKDVNLEKYAGTWYEIGHFPNFFQNMCERSTAQYTLNEKGTINVLNTCYKGEKVLTTITGEAYAPNKSEPTKLVVDFGFFRKGDYWIISLDNNYEWAVVSGPKKDSLFILSRTAPMDKNLLNSILEDLEKRGFETSKIIYDKY